MNRLRQLWTSSLLLRRVVASSVLILAALAVGLSSSIPRPLTLHSDDLNTKAVARLGQDTLVLNNPPVKEGDLVLSYEGSRNEVADLWLQNATLDAASQRLFFPRGLSPQPAPISYTTGGAYTDASTADTCHTTIEIRRAPGSPPIETLKLYQTDETAGAQRFRQLVLDAGNTTLQLLVHTDAPSSQSSKLPGCDKILTMPGNAPVELPLIPIQMMVTGGKIDLHFYPANPAVPIWTGTDQTFEAVSLGESILKTTALQIIPMQPLPGTRPKLDVVARPAGNLISIGQLKIASDHLRVDIGSDGEKALASANGEALYSYDLIAAIGKNLVLSFILVGISIPALWKWASKNLFP